ncbi:MAG: hypothetical protein IJU93_10060 [Lachnospiraceae bacterium]|nr:hypothetical protein [Lachnospiraceae bacterium]
MKQKETKKKKEDRAKTKRTEDIRPLPRKIYLLTIFELLFAPAVTFLCVYFKEGFSRYACFGAAAILIISGLGSAALIKEYPSLPYGNREHPVRNTVVFAALCLISLSMGFLPEFVVPLSSLCLIYMILTSVVTGYAHGLLFTAMAMCALGEGGWFFLYYFLGTILLFFLYSRISEMERVFVPLCFFALYRILFFAVISLLLNSELTPQLITAAAGGLMAELVICAIGLYRLRQDVINRRNLRLTELCDPEHNLLKSLREESREEFFRAVHTAYLCNLCAREVGADIPGSRALGYFHRIGVLRGDNMNIAQKSLSIALENNFDPELVSLIREYWGISGRKLSKEASIVILCDDIVYTIMDRFATSNNVNYDNIISDTMEFYMQYKRFQNSELTLRELAAIEKCLKGEKLYYDFLR